MKSLVFACKHFTGCPWVETSQAATLWTFYTCYLSKTLQKIKVYDFCDESNSSFAYKVTIFYKLDQVVGQHYANVIT